MTRRHLFPKGTVVYVKRHRREGARVVLGDVGEIEGGRILDRYVGGSRAWHVTDLEYAYPEQRRVKGGAK